MKAKIHPDYNKLNVTCACGNSFPSASTAKELKVEVCAACHPFFTGQQRFLDTAGRVERFQAKIDQQKKAAAEAEAKKAAKKGTAKAKAAPAAEGVPASEK
ncbi:MAG: 50S ribosomal protein L31 [bacterium ADurb.Bin374]|nr:MAG: 50S ribosomal protein L31 [bacterium ADurb.Bin374]